MQEFCHFSVWLLKIKYGSIFGLFFSVVGKIYAHFILCKNIFRLSSQLVNSSLYEKSSWYNRKRASRACLPHKVGALLGCSSKAVSGNIVKCHVGGVYTLSLT